MSGRIGKHLGIGPEAEIAAGRPGRSVKMVSLSVNIYQIPVMAVVRTADNLNAVDSHFG